MTPNTQDTFFILCSLNANSLHEDTHGENQPDWSLDYSDLHLLICFNPPLYAPAFVSLDNAVEVVNGGIMKYAGKGRPGAGTKPKHHTPT